MSLNTGTMVSPMVVGLFRGPFLCVQDRLPSVLQSPNHPESVVDDVGRASTRTPVDGEREPSRLPLRLNDV